MFRPALALAAALFSASCASVPGEAPLRGIDRYAEDPRLGEETRSVCFASTIDGFSMAERDSVLLHDGRKRYLVEVTPSCLDLEFAHSIALDSTLSCLTPGDAIIVGSAPGGGIGPRRCLIREIRNWNKDAEKPAEEAAEIPA
jgi:Family of unknown function (DUF6491)